MVKGGAGTTILKVDPDSASAECSIGDGDLLRLSLAFRDLQTGEQALLTVTPVDDSHRKAFDSAEFSLLLPSGETLTGRVAYAQFPRQNTISDVRHAGG